MMPCANSAILSAEHAHLFMTPCLARDILHTLPKLLPCKEIASYLRFHLTENWPSRQGSHGRCACGRNRMPGGVGGLTGETRSARRSSSSTPHLAVWLERPLRAPRIMEPDS